MEFTEWRENVRAEMTAMYEVLQSQPARPHDSYELLVKCGAYIARLSELYASPTGDCAKSFLAKKFFQIKESGGKTYELKKELEFTEEFIFAESVKERLRAVKQICEDLRSLLADDRSKT